MISEERNRTMPSEWHKQSAVQITWPHDKTDWNYMLDEVEECYVNMAREIAMREPLIIVTPDPDHVTGKLNHLSETEKGRIKFVKCPTNDTWARDHGFISTIDREKGLVACDFKFNGWGDKFEASLDNKINRAICEAGLAEGTYEPHLDFVLEGGSVESNGRGTILTTSTCLLAPHRNAMTKDEIENYLKENLGATNVLWLDYGALAGDDTDSHIDTLARLCPDNTIAYVKCSDTNDEHYEELKKMEEQLATFRNEEGEKFKLAPLPMADAVYSTQPGEEQPERIPATYANFLIINGAVLVPTYNQPENDKAALETLREVFPDREIVGINCSALIKQHGSLHCSAMQYPQL
ncbi:MAG: agmatine deiminase family protein [Bacteroidaceae bacterium]|nr:agmatine deiminase family protein [Bacteroidaceae bacterium]